MFVDLEKVYTFALANGMLVVFYLLFYGVMVAQQILVLFVLVRIRVEQQLKKDLLDSHPLFYGVMVAQQILVLFVLVRIRVEQLNPCLFSER